MRGDETDYHRAARVDAASPTDRSYCTTCGWLLPAGARATYAACGGDASQNEAPPAAESATPANDSTAVTDTYAPELGVDLSAMQQSSTGLYTQDLVEGSGDPAEAGDVVRVHYTGRLPDGTTFDSSVPRGEPFEVTLGQGRVIPGWEEGVEGMKVGGKRQLVIPAELAYGETGSGMIPPGATLIFEIELLDVQEAPSE